MKILAIESSALTASVALAEDDMIIAEYTTNYKKTHSQTLMPMIEELCKMTETDINSIEAAAVCAGPGSFTGLRIGAASAKGLGLALDIPVIAVPTLEAMAYNYYASPDFIAPIMDARRDQVYTGVFTFKKSKLEGNEVEYELSPVVQPEAMAITDLIEKMNSIFEVDVACNSLISRGVSNLTVDISEDNSIDRTVIFLGDGVPVFKDVIEKNAKFPYSFAPLNHNRQSAASIAAAAFDYHKQGKEMNAADFAPDYFRESQAEREAKNK